MMQFHVNNTRPNLNRIMREIGYTPVGYAKENELSAVRRLGGNYPRFHLYVKTTEKVITYSLHLDQKKPSYEGQTAHSGDYDGELVREETERIRKIVFEQ